jgi:hypothetical protein
VVIHNFNIESIPFVPNEADAPPIVYSEVVLTFTISFQFFKPVTAYGNQVPELPSRVQHCQFLQSNPLNRLELPNALALEKALSVNRTK